MASGLGQTITDVLPPNPMKHTYSFLTRNGRCYVYIDELIFFCFNQIDFKGFYAYKDDVNLYGIDIYLVDTMMEIYFKTKENWTETLKLLDKHL